MNKQELLHLLKLYNISPSKSKGQHFLLDDDALETIVDAAHLKKTDNVVEVGPGLAVLTERLIEKAGAVVCVEIDDAIVSALHKRFSQDECHIVHKDILRIKNHELTEYFQSQNYKVIANIPYNITSKIIRKFLTFDPKPTEMVLLIQKEVAERITASPGAMSVLSISVQFYADAEIIATVPKESFFPAPEVDSAIIRFIIPEKKYAEVTDEKSFFRLVKIGFAARRKKLSNTLSAGLRVEAEMLLPIFEELQIPQTVRAQELSIEQWIALHNRLEECGVLGQ